jgi:hypothetical protein
VWVERGGEGAIVTDSEPREPADPGSPGFDHYVLVEVVADLAVYHFAEPA